MNAACFTIEKDKYPYLFTHTLANISTVFHYHSFYEFVYVEEGTVVNLIDGKEYVLHAGEMSLVVPGEVHKITAGDSVRRDICISKDVFESLFSVLFPDVVDYKEVLERAKLFEPSGDSAKIILEKLGHFSIKLDKTDAESRILTCSLLTEVFSDLIPKENIAASSAVPPWIKTILLRFDNTKNIKEGLSSITEGINYSPIYINRVFKQYTGVNLRTFLNETRLKLAAIYIETSDYSTREISDMLGFSSDSFFYRQFKNKYGLTPTEYRSGHHDSGRIPSDATSD